MFQKSHIISCLVGILLGLIVALPASAQISSSTSKPNIGGLQLMQAVKGAGINYMGCTAIENFETNSALGSGNGKALETSICWLEDVSASLGVGMAMGSALMKFGFMDLFDRPGAIIVGLGILLSFFLIYLIFPLKLLDAFIRLGFIFALMPLWIVLWVFPATAQYTKKAFDMFIGTLLFFIALSIIVSLILIMMNESIQPATLRNEIFQKMLEGKSNEAVDLINLTRTFFIAVAFGCMSISLLGAAETLSNAFIGVPSLNMGGSMVTNVTQGYRFAKNVAKSAANAPGAAIAAGHAVGRGFTAATNWAKSKFGGGTDPRQQSAPAAKKNTFHGGGDTGSAGGNNTPPNTPPNGGSGSDTGTTPPNAADRQQRQSLLDGVTGIKNTRNNMPDAKMGADYANSAFNAMMQDNKDKLSPAEQKTMRQYLDGKITEDQAKEQLGLNKQQPAAQNAFDEKAVAVKMNAFEEAKKAHRSGADAQKVINIFQTTVQKSGGEVTQSDLSSMKQFLEGKISSIKMEDRLKGTDKD